MLQYFLFICLEYTLWKWGICTKMGFTSKYDKIMLKASFIELAPCLVSNFNINRTETCIRIRTLREDIDVQSSCWGLRGFHWKK